MLYITATVTEHVNCVSVLTVRIALKITKQVWNREGMVTLFRWKKNTPPWPTNKNFGLTDQAIISKQFDWLINDNELSTTNDSLSYLSKYPNELRVSVGSQPSERNHSILLKLTVTLFISSYHFICWPTGCFSAQFAKLKMGPAEIGQYSAYATHDLVIFVCTVWFTWKTCHLCFPQIHAFTTVNYLLWPFILP